MKEPKLGVRTPVRACGHLVSAYLPSPEAGEGPGVSAEKNLHIELTIDKARDFAHTAVWQV